MIKKIPSVPYPGPNQLKQVVIKLNEVIDLLNRMTTLPTEAPLEKTCKHYITTAVSGEPVCLECNAVLRKGVER